VEWICKRRAPYTTGTKEKAPGFDPGAFFIFRGAETFLKAALDCDNCNKIQAFCTGIGHMN
jgi:hypothetical protein